MTSAEEHAGEAPDPVQQLFQVATGYVISSALHVVGLGKILDLEMMTLPGGRERTAEEFRALFAGAGFAMTSITPTRSPVCVIEATRT